MKAFLLNPIAEGPVLEFLNVADVTATRRRHARLRVAGLMGGEVRRRHAARPWLS
jgi:hypothetical protein